MAQSDDLLATGIIKTAHGIKGDVKVHPYAEEYGHLLSIKNIMLKKEGRVKHLQVETCRPFGHDVLFKFQGIDTPEAGKALSGWEIWIPREQAAPLKRGEVYVTDLLGCALIHEGCAVATVVGTVEGAQALLLEVETGESKHYLIPYMNNYLGKVSIEEKTIELKAPWLLA